MRSLTYIIRHRKIYLFLMVTVLSGSMARAQEIRLDIKVNPLISWFRSDIQELRNEGSRAGLDLNLSLERYLGERFAAKAGLSLLNSAGRVKSNEPVTFIFPDFTADVPAGSPIEYHINFITIPFGLKYKSKTTGSFGYFAEVGLDPKIVIRGRVTIPSLDISNQSAMTQIRTFNLGYFLNAGIDYPLSENSTFIVGLGFENNFLDVTKDIGGQPSNRVTQNFLKFIFGINFSLRKP